MNIPSFGASTTAPAPDLFAWIESPPAAPASAAPAYEPPRYMQTPGWRDPETSLEAAERIAPHVARLRRRVLDLLREIPQGLSVHQIANRLRLPVATIQPRVSELRANGNVKPSGQRCTNETGASAHLWIVTNSGGPV